MTLINLKNFFFHVVQRIDRAIAHFCIELIIHLRPVLGPSNICPFYIGCTEFALIELEKNCIPCAAYKICIRLLKCNPIWIWIKTHSRF